MLCIMHFCVLVATSAEEPDPKGVVIQDLDGKLRIEIQGAFFTEYHYSEVQKPYFYPVIGPTGDTVTRHFPMKIVPDEEKNHPHHTSLWYAHGNVNGKDFWHRHPILHNRFTEIRSGLDKGWFTAVNHWVTEDGKIVFEEGRTVTIYNSTSPRLMDFSITFHASHGDLVIGDTKEGSLAVRLAPGLRVSGHQGKGQIINAEGIRDHLAWGKRSRWVDYNGILNNKAVGVAILDHPSNPRHPTWWHVRPYGLFAANPFGVHQFENKPEGTGDMRIPSGEKVTFKYRLVFHEGDHTTLDLDEALRAFIRQ